MENSWGPWREGGRFDECHCVFSRGITLPQRGSTPLSRNVGDRHLVPYTVLLGWQRGSFRGTLRVFPFKQLCVSKCWLRTGRHCGQWMKDPSVRSSCGHFGGSKRQNPKLLIDILPWRIHCVWPLTHGPPRLTSALVTVSPLGTVLG